MSAGKTERTKATVNPGGPLPSLRGLPVAYAQAAFAEFWAGFWPALLPLLGVASLFLILSWSGVWQVLPFWAHVAGIACLGLAALIALKPLFGLRLPARTQILRRIETESELTHRPIHTLSESMASPADAESTALWAAHCARMTGRITGLSGGFPSARIPERDPYALRAIIVLLLVVAAAYAGPSRGERLALAFDFYAPSTIDVARLDAWVSPPFYTGRAPMILLRASTENDITQETVSVPAGSILIVRSERDDGLAVDFTDQAGMVTTTEAKLPDEDRSANANTQKLSEIRMELRDSGIAMIRQNTRELMVWPFSVTPDNAPTIALQEAPERLTSGATKLAYELADDYGVVRAKAQIEAARDGTGSENIANADPLISAPSFDLTLPQLRTRSGAANTIRDLTAHPWAGVEVVLTLTAEDDRGQIGASDPYVFHLPSRQFLDPLAKALVEQRHLLAIERDNQDLVWRSLDALTLAADDFDMAVDIYLGIRSAGHRLINAENDEQLVSVVDQLWDIALAIENGGLSDAARRLQDAQEALQTALDRDTSDEEIAELADELRQALNEFMQKMALQAQNPDNLNELGDLSNMDMLSSQNLNDMLDAIEDMARSGARDEAQQLLSELRNMLENLQAGNTGEQTTEQSAMARALQELSELIQRQQELMDQTFRLDRFGQQGQQNQPMTAEELEQALRNAFEGLQSGQGSLAEALEALRRQLGGMGEGQGQGMMPGQGQLGQAGRAMQRALGSLGQGDPGQAQGAQAEALQALRDGARQLADALANAMGMTGRVQGPQRTDPFGRPMRTQGLDLGNSVKVPDQFDAERARELLRELRRRLSEPGRSRPEREYLERLLGR